MPLKVKTGSGARGKRGGVARGTAPHTASRLAQGAARKTAPRKVAKPVREERSELEIIPGVGVSIAEDLNRIGIAQVAQLKHENPERLYEHLCAVDGVKHDRCLLYVFRCAVYYASKKHHDPEKLKWWNWKDADAKSAPKSTSKSARRIPRN